MSSRILVDKREVGPGAWVKSGATQHAFVVSFVGSPKWLTVAIEGRIGAGPPFRMGEGLFSEEDLRKGRPTYLFVKDTPIDDIRANVVDSDEKGLVNVDYKSDKN